MERVISDEEKIRRAIEISQRRNQSYSTRESARVNVNNKKDYRLFKKMILQIIICLLIYLIFYLISTTNYVFSDQVLKSTTNILSYDINLEKMYQECKNFFVTNFNINDGNGNFDSNINSVIENNLVNENMNEADKNIMSETTDTNTLINETVVKEEENKKEEKEIENNKKNEEETAMEEDAEKVKQLCKFQKPLSGTVTSEFGEREVILNGMTSDHKGIDIAAESGTNIKAAMTGTVSVAGENSEYGKFIKIVNGDVMTVYAHCEKLKVKKGDKVKKGKTIATVGSTGNSTGPHLHFEIRLENRYINPRNVINF